MAAMLRQNQVMSAPGNLVEMPILSEEFLNQLNEEQLQALLEQQQQLMMLQQQQIIQLQLLKIQIMYFQQVILTLVTAMIVEV